MSVPRDLAAVASDPHVTSPHVTSEAPPQPGPSRRGLLGAGLSAAVFAGFATRARALQVVGTSAGTSDHQPAVRVAIDPLRFLVDRATNGWNADTWTHAQQLGYEAYLEEQLAWETISDGAMDALLAGYPTLTMTSKQLYDTYVVPNQNSVVVNELRTATILRGALSKRQLYERMVEFWNDHFNVDQNDGQVQWLKTAEDRDVIRVHALGNFKDLLRADAKSAAMLFYLDNNRNFATAPNENYSREVMELHTLGVGNYTETDVIEVARCLTGWQYYPASNPQHGVFFFNPAVHDNGAKTVLGHSIAANGGINDGEQVIDILANHPATAQFIARKLCRWFLSYDPPQSVVDRVANEFTVSGGDIRATVRVVLQRGTVKLVPQGTRTKIKRPFQLVASVVRTTTPTMTQPQRLINELASMGHRPFSWPTPDGYPDTAAVWGTSLLPRWTFLTRLFGNSIQGINVDVATLFAGVPKSQLAEHANQLLGGGALSSEDVGAVQAYADSAPNLNDTLRRDVLALSTSSPSFQYF